MDLTFDKSKLVIGTRQVLRLILKDQISLVYIAKDADSFVKNKIIDACNSKNVPFLLVSTKEEMGKMADIEVFAACIGIKN